MTRGKKIAIAIVVMGAGLVVAMFFRHGSPSQPAPTVVSERMPKTEPQKPRDAAPGKPQLLGRIGPPLRSSSGPKSTFGPSPESPAVSEPSPSNEPWLPSGRYGDYRARPSASPSTSGPPQGDRAWISDQQTARQHATVAPTSVLRIRTHTIRDGDTLSYLAQHYLGSGQRHLEIFQANRDVLRHPDLLPIGVKLKIPPRERPAQSQGADSRKKDQMVPIRPGALRRDRDNNQARRR